MKKRSPSRLKRFIVINYIVWGKGIGRDKIERAICDVKNRESVCSPSYNTFSSEEIIGLINST